MALALIAAVRRLRTLIRGGAPASPESYPGVRGAVADAMRTDDVALLESDPGEFVRRTRQPLGWATW